MKSLSNHKSGLIMFLVIIGWLTVAGLNAWWLWNRYQFVSQPDSSQINAATTQLNTIQLEKAIQALETD